MQRVIDAFHERLEENVTEACERVLRANIPFYSTLPWEAMRMSVKRVFEAVGQDLVNGESQAYPKLLAAIGAQRSGQGVTTTEVLRGMSLGFETVSDHFAVRFAGDLEARLYWEQARARVSYVGAAALADAYLAARENVVRAQAEEIAQLSARVLPLYPGILVLPLVGTLDAPRAAQLTQVLLEAVVANASSVVLIDVTGLPFVGAGTAAHLTAAARAVELLGARPILVGVRPNMARTMVDAGVDLAGLVTLADLASGLRYALDRLGMTIAKQRAAERS